MASGWYVIPSFITAAVYSLFGDMICAALSKLTRKFVLLIFAVLTLVWCVQLKARFIEYGPEVLLCWGLIYGTYTSHKKGFDQLHKNHRD